MDSQTHIEEPIEIIMEAPDTEEEAFTRNALLRRRVARLEELNVQLSMEVDRLRDENDRLRNKQ